MTKKKNTEAKILPFPGELVHFTLAKLLNQVEESRSFKKEICEQAAQSILKALDMKDHYTFGHSMRVAHYALCLGEQLELSREELYDLELAAMFHDIGKIGIPDHILNKPARLDEDEFQLMKTHPVKSAEILSTFQEFTRIAKYARHHHERYDGRGYPSGLKGDNIPLFSRAILIADTFDSMTSTRPYREGLSYEVAFEELDEYAGSQFDPTLVMNFIDAMDRERHDETGVFELNIVKGPFKKAA